MRVRKSPATSADATEHTENHLSVSSEESDSDEIAGSLLELLNPIPFIAHGLLGGQPGSSGFPVDSGSSTCSSESSRAASPTPVHGSNLVFVPPQPNSLIASSSLQNNSTEAEIPAFGSSNFKSPLSQSINHEPSKPTSSASANRSEATASSSTLSNATSISGEVKGQSILVDQKETSLLSNAPSSKLAGELLNNSESISKSVNISSDLNSSPEMQVISEQECNATAVRKDEDHQQHEQSPVSRPLGSIAIPTPVQKGTCVVDIVDSLEHTRNQIPYKHNRVPSEADSESDSTIEVIHSAESEFEDPILQPDSSPAILDEPNGIPPADRNEEQVNVNIGNDSMFSLIGSSTVTLAESVYVDCRSQGGPISEKQEDGQARPPSPSPSTSSSLEFELLDLEDARSEASDSTSQLRQDSATPSTLSEQTNEKTGEDNVAKETTKSVYVNSAGQLLTSNSDDQEHGPGPNQISEIEIHENMLKASISEQGTEQVVVTDGTGTLNNACAAFNEYANPSELGIIPATLISSEAYYAQPITVSPAQAHMNGSAPTKSEEDALEESQYHMCAGISSNGHEYAMPQLQPQPQPHLIQSDTYVPWTPPIRANTSMTTHYYAAQPQQPSTAHYYSTFFGSQSDTQFAKKIDGQESVYKESEYHNTQFYRDQPLGSELTYQEPTYKEPDVNVTQYFPNSPLYRKISNGTHEKVYENFSKEDDGAEGDSESGPSGGKPKAEESPLFAGNEALYQSVHSEGAKTPSRELELELELEQSALYSSVADSTPSMHCSTLYSYNENLIGTEGNSKTSHNLCSHCAKLALVTDGDRQPQPAVQTSSLNDKALVDAASANTCTIEQTDLVNQYATFYYPANYRKLEQSSTPQAMQPHYTSIEHEQTNEVTSQSQVKLPNWDTAAVRDLELIYEDPQTMQISGDNSLFADLERSIEPERYEDTHVSLNVPLPLAKTAQLDPSGTQLGANVDNISGPAPAPAANDPDSASASASNAKNNSKIYEVLRPLPISFNFEKMQFSTEVPIKSQANDTVQKPQNVIELAMASHTSNLESATTMHSKGAEPILTDSILSIRSNDAAIPLQSLHSTLANKDKDADLLSRLLSDEFEAPREVQTLPNQVPDPSHLTVTNASFPNEHLAPGMDTSLASNPSSIENPNGDVNVTDGNDSDYYQSASPIIARTSKATNAPPGLSSLASLLASVTPPPFSDSSSDAETSSSDSDQMDRGPEANHFSRSSTPRLSECEADSPATGTFVEDMIASSNSFAFRSSTSNMHEPNATQPLVGPSAKANHSQELQMHLVSVSESESAAILKHSSTASSSYSDATPTRGFGAYTLDMEEEELDEIACAQFVVANAKGASKQSTATEENSFTWTRIRQIINSLDVPVTSELSSSSKTITQASSIGSSSATVDASKGDMRPLPPWAAAIERATNPVPLSASPFPFACSTPPKSADHGATSAGYMVCNLVKPVPSTPFPDHLKRKIDELHSDIPYPLPTPTSNNEQPLWHRIKEDVNSPPLAITTTCTSSSMFTMNSAVPWFTLTSSAPITTTPTDTKLNVAPALAWKSLASTTVYQPNLWTPSVSYSLSSKFTLEGARNAGANSAPPVTTGPAWKTQSVYSASPQQQQSAGVTPQVSNQPTGPQFMPTFHPPYPMPLSSPPPPPPPPPMPFPPMAPAILPPPFGFPPPPPSPMMAFMPWTSTQTQATWPSASAYLQTPSARVPSSDTNASTGYLSTHSQCYYEFPLAPQPSPSATSGTQTSSAERNEIDMYWDTLAKPRFGNQTNDTYAVPSVPQSSSRSSVQSNLYPNIQDINNIPKYSNSSSSAYLYPNLGVASPVSPASSAIVSTSYAPSSSASLTAVSFSPTKVIPKELGSPLTVAPFSALSSSSSKGAFLRPTSISTNTSASGGTGTLVSNVNMNTNMRPVQGSSFSSSFPNPFVPSVGMANLFGTNGSPSPYATPTWNSSAAAKEQEENARLLQLDLQLVSMGFTNRPANKRALLDAKLDLNEALNRLIDTAF